MFKKGQAKVGGRKKGTPNKNSLKLEAQLEKHGIDAVAIIAERLPLLPPEKAVDVAMRLLPYLHPTRRSVEIVEPFDFGGDGINEFSLDAVKASIEAFKRATEEGTSAAQV